MNESSGASVKDNVTCLKGVPMEQCPVYVAAAGELYNLSVHSLLLSYIVGFKFEFLKPFRVNLTSGC